MQGIQLNMIKNQTCIAVHDTGLHGSPLGDEVMIT